MRDAMQNNDVLQNCSSCWNPSAAAAVHMRALTLLCRCNSAASMPRVPKASCVKHVCTLSTNACMHTVTKQEAMHTLPLKQATDQATSSLGRAQQHCMCPCCCQAAAATAAACHTGAQRKTAACRCQNSTSTSSTAEPDHARLTQHSAAKGVGVHVP